MSNESTLVLIKPDGVNRALIGKVIDRLESTGLKIIGMKLILIDKDLASKHYEEHKEKPFFSSLVEFITSSPVVALAYTCDRLLLCGQISHLYGHRLRSSDLSYLSLLFRAIQIRRFRWHRRRLASPLAQRRVGYQPFQQFLVLLI